METVVKWSKEKSPHKLVDKKLFPKQNGRIAIPKNLSNIFKTNQTLQIQSLSRSECAGSCPDLTMSRIEPPRPVTMALTPQLPPRVHRPLCLSVSSDSSGRFKALETQEWKNNLKAQMEKAHSAGAASSTGSLERASLFCASGSAAASSPTDVLNRNKSSSRFSLFSPPWNSSSESDSNPPSRSGSKKLRNHSRRAATGPAGVGGHVPETPEHFQYSEPLISKVTDYIYVGNLNAAYNGRTLCRNDIDGIIDMSSAPGEPRPALSLVPCTCSRRTRHSWSRLKVDIRDVPDALGDSPTLEQRCFQDINGCIEASAEKKKRVLVHCRDGLSLAPTCVIQYLMVKHRMGLLAAYELLRSRHPLNIRAHHQDVLVSLERTLNPGGGMAPEGFKQAISRRVAWT